MNQSCWKCVRVDQRSFAHKEIRLLRWEYIWSYAQMASGQNEWWKSCSRGSGDDPQTPLYASSNIPCPKVPCLSWLLLWKFLKRNPMEISTFSINGVPFACLFINTGEYFLDATAPFFTIAGLERKLTIPSSFSSECTLQLTTLGYKHATRRYLDKLYNQKRA